MQKQIDELTREKEIEIEIDDFKRENELLKAHSITLEEKSALFTTIDQLKATAFSTEEKLALNIELTQLKTNMANYNFVTRTNNTLLVDPRKMIKKLLSHYLEPLQTQPLVSQASSSAPVDDDKNGEIEK